MRVVYPRADPAKAGRRSPVPVVTGLLGSGKTTLINRILHEGHDRKIVLIVNEFGEFNVDGRSTLRDGPGDLAEFNDWPLCGTARGGSRQGAAIG